MEKWTEKKAWDWYSQQPWILGCNFTPSTAINQLEMWQAETFDVETIERELNLAQSIGFNTIRVYLHDLLWLYDAPGFIKRIDHFLQIANERNILPIFVIFDDCWNNEFSFGQQPDPKPGVHNSGWVQSPGNRTVLDPSKWSRLKIYVQGLLSVFGRDSRIRMWDLYNEPGNSNMDEQSLGLAKEVFHWAREVDPVQPLTMGVWYGNESLNEFQLASSDIITFHDYNPLDKLKNSIEKLKQFGRPLICTEYMARTRGSRFETHLPVFKSENVGCINWGLVAGKTQTHLPWASETIASDEWFHDIFYSDNTPYRESEIDLIRMSAGLI